MKDKWTRYKFRKTRTSARLALRPLDETGLMTPEIVDIEGVFLNGSIEAATVADAGPPPAGEVKGR